LVLDGGYTAQEMSASNEDAGAGAGLGASSGAGAGHAGALGQELARSVSGQVVVPGDADYERARRVWNGRIGRHPAAIVLARNTEDVQRTIEVARSQDVQLFIRGGGHNVAGTAVGDGLVLDLSGPAGSRSIPNET
jgi:FAD/FMN-containing dehydrogenase